jgi:hypothetical protein
LWGSRTVFILEPESKNRQGKWRNKVEQEMVYPIKSVTVLMLSSFAGGLYVAMSDITTAPQATGSEPTASTACAELQQTCRQGERPGCIGSGLTPNAR